MLNTKDASLAAAKADWARVRSDVAYVQVLMLGLRWAEAVYNEEKFSADQPRVPPGQTGGGQWTSGGGGPAFGGSDASSANGRSGDANVQPALFNPLTIPLAKTAAQAAAEAAIYLYLYLTGKNSKDATAVLEFNAQEFLPGASKSDPAIGVRPLTKEEVDAACPRHGEVQTLTDDAAARVRREGNYLTPTQYGTKVHKELKDRIDDIDDLNFRAEYSSKKSIQAGYGEKDSVRVDILENVGDGTVCVYDIKTGDTRMSPARMLEIASNTHSLYPGTKKILIIETRPR